MVGCSVYPDVVRHFDRMVALAARSWIIDVIPARLASDGADSTSPTVLLEPFMSTESQMPRRATVTPTSNGDRSLTKS
jgi:hypothetical protein